MKKVVSYSLYNNRPKDTINAVINCLLLPKIYPGWIGRFYVDDTIPKCIDQLLRSFEYVEVIDIERHRGMEASSWRFLAAIDADVMISRDADSWISSREKACVDAWLASDKKYHIIRDHCYHSHKIMAGMWGVRDGIPNISAMIGEVCRNNTNDQVFLANEIYPKIDSLMVHYGEPQYDNQGRKITGHYNDGGIPIPAYQEDDEPIAGLSFREANTMNAFFCAHCKKTHDVLIGGITENIPPRALQVVKDYAASKGIIWSV